MIADNRAILARLDEEEIGLVAANAAMSERQASAATRRQTSEGVVAESEQQLAELTGGLAEITARRGQYSRAVAEADERIARQGREVAAVEAELRSLDAAAAAAAPADAHRAAVAAAEARLAEAESESASAERRSGSARDGVSAAREPLSEAERGLGRIEAEAATLVAMLTTTRVEGHTPVIDSVKVAGGYEAALGAAFGDDLDAPVDPSAPAHWRAVAVAADDARLPAGCEPLANYVEAPAVLSRRLAQTGIVAADDGARLQSLLKPGQRLVTRAGDLWRWDGYAAAADSPRVATQRLANRNRLAELDKDGETARAIVASRRAEYDAAVAAARAAEEIERQARESWRQSQKAVDEQRTALASVEREAARIAARRSGLDEARSRLAANIAEQAAARAKAAEGLATTPAPESLAAGMTSMREKVGRDRAGLAEARAAVESLAREAEMRSSRLATIAVERQNWHEHATNAESQIATLSARRNEAGAERTWLAEEPAKIETKRVALLSEIAAAETARGLATDRLAVGEAALAEADKQARAALDALAEAREQRGRAEERVGAARERLSEVTTRINEALDCPPEEAAAVAGLKPDAPLPGLGETEARLERYRQERERLGAVNLRAEAEATEVAQRRDAMVAERDDLVAAIQRLRQGIVSLNREGRERLTAAFVTVNAEFQRLFTHLFGGGVAELQLTESDDPLEAGLEILARPPGKKPQIMTLLSGGEQALTALALIFAVFLTNPAPICVLDEVDAPLDDANVERFCNLLDEMTRSTDTRFVVITHNPITMSRMNRLFGVTMAERGVSQLVSVDLQTAERFREVG
jgi:chromosome segregation protein